MLLVGAVSGAVIGAGTAYLLLRTAEENDSEQPPQINTSDILRTVVGVVGTMRGIAALGKNK